MAMVDTPQRESESNILLGKLESINNRLGMEIDRLSDKTRAFLFQDNTPQPATEGNAKELRAQHSELFDECYSKIGAINRTLDALSALTDRIES